MASLRYLLVSIAVLSAHGTLSAAPVLLDFSPPVYTLDRLTIVMWQDFEMKLPEIYKQIGMRDLPDGGAVIVDARGERIGSLQVMQRHAPDATAREVGLKFTGRENQILFFITVRTFGQSLSELSVSEIRSGQLPWLPRGDNEWRTEIRVWQGDRPSAKLVIQRSTPGAADITWLAHWYDGNGTPFMRYSEHATTGQRSISYWLNPPGGSTPFTLEAERTRAANEILGSETHQMNGNPVAISRFGQGMQHGVLQVIAELSGAMARALERLQHAYGVRSEQLDSPSGPGSGAIIVRPRR